MTDQSFLVSYITSLLYTLEAMLFYVECTEVLDLYIHSLKNIIMLF